MSHLTDTFDALFRGESLTDTRTHFWNAYELARVHQLALEEDIRRGQAVIATEDGTAQALTDGLL